MKHLSIRNIALALMAVAGLAVATPASAELLFFADSRSMSVASHRIEGDRIIVKLRGGGEMTFDSALVVKIGPDEVPYSEPASTSVDGEIDRVGPTGIDGMRVPMLAGTTSFDPIIDRASAQHGLDARLVKAVIQVESGFQSRARSPKGAMGLMQLMPATAREYQAGGNPYDPARNIQAGTKYLRKLLTEFGKELPLALAAYNAGENAVRRFGGIPPYA